MLNLVDMLLYIFFFAVVDYSELRPSKFGITDEDLVFILDEVHIYVSFEVGIEGVVGTVKKYHVCRYGVILKLKKTVLAYVECMHFIKVGKKSGKTTVTHK